MFTPGFLARIRWIFGWIWFIGGLVCIGVAVLFVAMTASFIHNGVETSGRVVSLVAVENEQDHITNYAPIFTFTANRQTYTITSTTATYPPAFTAGETVRVLYDPQNPAHARIKSTAQLWMVSIICAPLGAFLSLIGGVLLYVDRRYRRRIAAAVTTGVHA